MRKAFKYILQVLSAFLYTPLYTGIMYLAIVFPVYWILSLSFWKMVVAIVFLGGVIEGLRAFLQTAGIFPFAWIVKGNKFALGISSALCVISPILNAVMLWRLWLGHGAFGILIAVVFSLMLLWFAVTSIIVLFNCYNDFQDQ